MLLLPVTWPLRWSFHRYLISTVIHADRQYLILGATRFNWFKATPAATVEPVTRNMQTSWAFPVKFISWGHSEWIQAALPRHLTCRNLLVKNSKANGASTAVVRNRPLTSAGRRKAAFPKKKRDILSVQLVSAALLYILHQYLKNRNWTQVGRKLNKEKSLNC